MKSLELRSEMLVLDGLSHLTDHGDFWVQKTPAEPTFWTGNQIIFKRSDVTAAQAEALFAKHLPGALHRSYVWDIPGLQKPLIDPDFALTGHKIDANDALSLTGVIADAPTPAGITIRPLISDDDWAQSFATQLDIGMAEGFPHDGYSAYLQRRQAGWRGQIARDRGQWFGAFDGALLVAQMGMFHDQSVARYQAVETIASHRRRGICAALLRHACLWALGRAPNATPVIVAERDSDAGRLYRRMGFAHSQTILGALRPPA